MGILRLFFVRLGHSWRWPNFRCTPVEPPVRLSLPPSPRRVLCIHSSLLLGHFPVHPAEALSRFAYAPVNKLIPSQT